MNKLDTAKRAQILALLCEGLSIRSVSRIVDVSINTVSKLLVDAGRACEGFHHVTVRNVPAKRIQCDDIWSFIAAKAKNVPGMKRPADGAGDCWTWIALDADSKLIVSWLVGGHDAGCAHEFMNDVADRLANRVQLTTDGYSAYMSTVEAAFGSAIDCAQLVKQYGAFPESAKGRYNPTECIGAIKAPIEDNPERRHTTRYVERSNLTMGTSMRRFTRLTNAFSKKPENHGHMVALYTVWHNFVRIHKTLGVTPAMQAKLTDKLWSMADVVELLD